MRVALIVAALFVVATGPAGAVERIPAATLRQNLFASCFHTETDGWAVGDLARMFRTTDGGKSWERHDTSTGRSFVALSCPDAQHLWAAGQLGEITHSTDGGTTWTLQQTGVQRKLLDIDFATLQHGLAVGDYGTLLRTDDGGTTWARVPIPHDITLPPDVAEVVDPGDVVLYAVAFPDPEHAWVAGEFGVILASADGGRTWQAQKTPVETSLFGVAFADARRGWAVGLESTLLATTDGGTTWTTVQVDTPKGFPLALYDVAVHGQYGWAAGNSGLLLHSRDGGVSWQLVEVPVQLRGAWFRAVSLLEGGRGFIMGSKGMVLSTDGDGFVPLKQRF